MSTEKFEWGKVEWFENSIENLNIGISYLKPNFCQQSHIHYENEQWIYVLKGFGRHMVNDEIKTVKEGDHIYLPYNSVHSTLNLTDEPLVELIITSPRKNQNFRIKEFSLIRYAEYKNDLNAAVDALNLEEECPEYIPLLIRDLKGNIIFLSKILRELDYDISVLNNHEDKNIIAIPLKIDEEIIGELYCDLNILMNQSSNYADISESSLNSIKSFLINLSSSINSLCKFNSIQKNYIKNSMELKSKKTHDLNEEENELESPKSSNNLKINFHFLFNTLNYIASLAFEQDNEELYKAIIVLSRLFRYISDNSAKMITIRDEINYLENYIYLQQLRYKENLKVEYTIDDSVLNSKIPINCLQPILENAFSHGFLKYDGQKKIEINIKETDENRVQILIKNNGQTLDMSNIRKIKASLPLGEDHGLMLVYDKLKLNYGDDFILDTHLENNLTVFEINIPNRKE